VPDTSSINPSASPNATATLSPDDCLAPGEFVDSSHPAVAAYAAAALSASGVGAGATDRDRAVALFEAVRDGIRYDPYDVSYEPAAFRASHVSDTERNWCVPKSILLTAACRSVGIPAALGFADVRNHLQSAKLLERMGTDLFVYHGYSVLWVDDRWQKVSSAFNSDMCRRFGTKVLEWDGTGDALMHAHDAKGDRHMEYVNDRGWHVDMPLDEMMRVFAEVYPSSLSGDAAEVTDEMFDH